METQAYVWVSIIAVLVLVNIKAFERNRVLGMALLLGGIGISLITFLTQILVKLDKILVALSALK